MQDDRNKCKTSERFIPFNYIQHEYHNKSCAEQFERLINMKKYVVVFFKYSAISLTLWLNSASHTGWKADNRATKHIFTEKHDAFLAVTAAVWYWDQPKAGKCFQWCRELLIHWSSQQFHMKCYFFFDRHFPGWPDGRGSLSSQWTTFASRVTDSELCICMESCLDDCLLFLFPINKHEASFFSESTCLPTKCRWFFLGIQPLTHISGLMTDW